MPKDPRDTKNKNAGADQLAKRLKSIQSAAEAESKHVMCPMAKILKALDEETAKCLYEVLNDDVTTTTAIMRAMKQAGRGVARETVADYRSRLCSCADGDKCGLDERFGN